MKIHRVVFLLLLTLSFSLAENLEKKVAMTGISKVEQIIGYLNEPYGTIVNITGTVKLDTPGKEPSRHLLVTHINGRKLDQAITFDLWWKSLPNAKHGDVIEAKAYERLMMLGVPKDSEDLKDPVIQLRGKGGEFRLVRFLHVLPE